MVIAQFSSGVLIALLGIIVTARINTAQQAMSMAQARSSKQQADAQLDALFGYLV